MSVMPGPFPQNLPPLTAAEKADLQERAKKKRNIAIAAEVSGLAILSVGLGLMAIWVGVAVFGLGLLLLGIGLELS